ncbi:GNAT family N-acetyltransferase [Vibrio palustris]|uniref:Acetyltransferase (GNAT) family protein n=1 Tax=Vibrio palustris TaxID=1918946 RepID=A0A1R4B4B5_9VIBR|nr:GNAT family N-acetyltransferase [Vibrio palustris]SJL83762.1 Acetyltransferase (GNAT) family protein [Vibrio palustris]
MDIHQADKTHIEDASKLFDLYRQFYGQPSNINASTEFLSERFSKQDSKFFIAFDLDGEPVGFVQLYPSFSSVAMKTMWYLNDLFVIQNVRGKGVASELLNYVKIFAKNNDSVSLKLATTVDNLAAKALYEKHGYCKITAFDHYVLRIDTV